MEIIAFVCLPLSDIFHILSHNIIFFYLLTNNYPAIHRFFPDGPPKILKFKIMRSFVVIDKERYYMSPDIEDYFASGKNWEHSEGSVHQTKLEVFITVRKWWNERIANAKGNVCMFLLYDK